MRGREAGAPGDLGSSRARCVGRDPDLRRWCADCRSSTAGMEPVGAVQEAGASTTVSIEPRVPIDVVAVRDGALPEGSAAPSSAISVDR